MMKKFTYSPRTNSSLKETNERNETAKRRHEQVFWYLKNKNVQQNGSENL